MVSLLNGKEESSWLFYLNFRMENIVINKNMYLYIGFYFLKK